jgi:adenylylsulfate kinase-like enzyme
MMNDSAVAAVIWLTGLSDAGKATIARASERHLGEQQYRAGLLDGDQLRDGLCGDPGFSHTSRMENIRREGEVARLSEAQAVQELLVCPRGMGVAEYRR